MALYDALLMLFLKKNANQIFVILSAAVFSWLIVGPKALNPKNISWIQGDNWASYVASKYWLNSPWHLPIGSNPGYGMENSTAITYTGPSYPILIFQKLFRIDSDYQLFGIWIALNILLLIYFSFKFALKFSGLAFHSAVFSILCIAPFFLLRVQMHLWLISFFLIFMAMIEATKTREMGKKPTARFVLLLVLSYVINIYLLAMVLLILIGGIVYFSCHFGIELKKLAVRFLFSVVSLAIVSMVLDGTFTKYASNFTPRSILTPSYGAHPGNLLGFVNPDNGLISEGLGWGFSQQNFSITGASLGNIAGDYEGYSYLGLGSILLVFLAVTISWKDILAFVKNKSNHFLLIYITLICLFIFTFRVGFGRFESEFPFPVHLNYMLSVFRSSGRFYWILAYLLLILGYLSVAKKMNSHQSFLIFTLLLIIQIVDLGPSVWERHTDISNQNAVEILSKAEEKILLDSTIGVDSIRYWPNSNFPSEWAEVSYFAAQRNIPTNGVATSRPNFEVMRSIDVKTKNELCSSRMMNNTMYVVPRQKISELGRCLKFSKSVGVLGKVVLLRKSD